MSSVVAAAPDDTLWAVGYELNFDDGSERGVNLDGGVVRHFDRNGKTLGAFVPRSSIEDISHLSLQFSMLAATADRVGWLHYDYKGKAHGAYVEISRDGNFASYPLPEPREPQPHYLLELGGMAITDSGDTFVVVKNRTNHVQSDFTLLALNRSAGRWMPVRMVPAPAKAGEVLGSNGNELAFWLSGSGYSTVHFFTPDKK